MSIRFGLSIIFITCVFLICSGTGAYAQQSITSNTTVSNHTIVSDNFLNYKEPQKLTPPNFKHLLLRIVGVLFLIIISIVFISWILKILLQDKSGILKSNKERYFEVVDRLYLDHKRVIYLIKIIDEILVVGGTSDSLNILSKIDDDKKVEALSSKQFLPLLKLFHKKTGLPKEIQNG